MKSPYLQLLKQGFSEITLYSLDFLLSSLQSIAMMGTPIFIWVFILPSFDTQTLPQKVAYLLLANGISMFTGATRIRLGKDMSNIIKEGQLSRYLLRPLSPLVQILYERVGTRLNELIIGLVALVVGVIIIHPDDPLRLVYFVIGLLCAIMIGTAYNVILGSVALWVEDGDGIMYGSLQISRMLNGTNIPLTLFRATLGAFAGYLMIGLPFAGMAFTPAHILTATTLVTEDYFFMISSVVWGVLLPLIASIIWKKGLRRYEGIGA